jgi:3-methyladenine DNA glycosylase/8-oxoguanine DNA glycosylase
MSPQSFVLPAPDDFDLAGVATSHGWYALAPYRWEVETNVLHRVEAFPSGAVAHLRVSQADLHLVVTSSEQLSDCDRGELERRLRWCLRLNEDLSEFHALCASDPALCAAVQPSRGRLLRCPTLFEDVVKVVLTTNTTWAQTKAMAARLVGTLGSPVPSDPSLRAFPSPGAVAEAGETVFAEQIRLGYRNGSVLRIAREVDEGRLDLESWRDSDLPTLELRKRLLALPGVGPYATATLLMILGRYDELAIDTELRSHVSRKYFAGGAVTEKQMRAVYEHWGRWRYLAYWFDPR